MDYKTIIDELQALTDSKPSRNFYSDLKLIVGRLEDSSDVRVLKVVARYNKLLSEYENPFDWKKVEYREPNSRLEINELTIKLIDFLNDHFEFLKPLK